MNLSIRTREETPQIDTYCWYQAVGLILTTIVILVLLFLVIGIAIPNPLYKMYYITSGSMSPTIEAGDLICVGPVTPTTVIKAGDIITYTYNGSKTTHRVVEVQSDDTIITQGDANNTIDTFSGGWRLTREHVIGIYKLRIPIAGRFIYWLKSIFGQQDSGAYLSDSETIQADIVSEYTGSTDSSPE